MSVSNGPILVPLDGRVSPEYALPGAIALAHRLGCGLRLLHVIHPDGDRSADDDAVGLARLEQLAARSRKQGVPCDTAVAVGDPLDAVLYEAERSAARYISVVRDDRSGHDRSVGGGAFHALLHQAGVPVLVWGGALDDLESGLVNLDGPIVVPLDGSARARQAIAEAVPLARALGVSMVLVRAVEPYVTISDLAPIDLGATIAQTEVADFDLRNVDRRVEAGGIGAWSTIGFGPPGQVIANAAIRHGASMVVMATHARVGVRRLLLGSVADSVIRKARVPVMLLGPHADANSHDPQSLVSRAA